MPPQSRLKTLVDQPEQVEEVQTSRLKDLVEPEPQGFLADLKQGAQSGIPFSGVETPETLGGRIGQVGTESAMMAIPMGAAATRIKPVIGEAKTIVQKLQNFTHGIGRQFAKGPKKFVAAEAGMGATSGAGGFYANEAFPDSEAARFIGEVLGGSAPAAAKATVRGGVRVVNAVSDKLPVIRTAVAYGKQTWKEIARTMNAKTAGGRASERFQRATSGQSPAEIAESMDADVLPAAREIMTPAQLSGNRGLLSLEKSVISESDALRNKSAEQLESLNEVILGSMRGDVGESAAREGAEGIRRDYTALLNERVAIAARQADEDIEKMFPKNSAEDANRIARNSIEGALDDARAQEKVFWDRVNQQAITPTGNTQNRLRELQREAGQTGAHSIPSYAVDFFSRNGRSSLGGLTTVKEMRNAQSTLRNLARNNRKGADPDFNMARIADDLANSITEDLALSQGQNADLVSEAVNFSRQKNEVFRQGAVGRIMRTGADSGDMIPEALTLSDTLGRTGGKGGQAFDDIWAAASFNDGDPNEIYQAMDSFVKDEFMRAAVRDGGVNRASANSFLRNNKEVLDRFPQIKQDIERAIQSGDMLTASNALRKEGLKSLDDPKVSKAALLINQGPEKAFNEVFNARNPRLEVQKLVDMVGDGEAFEGLQQGFMDYLMSKSVNESGVLSGASLSELTTSRAGRATVLELFKPDEAKRLFQIVKAAERQDAARAARTSIEGVTGDKLSQTTDALLGVMGAAYGRSVGTRIGAGGTVQIPGIFAQQFRKLGISGLVNPAKRLIIASIFDEDLFKKVLMAENPEKLSPVALRRLNAWAVGAAGRTLEEDE